MLIHSITNDFRRARMKEIVASGELVRLIEVHNPISAIIAENARVDEGAGVQQFDGFWSSSLTDSTSRGLPDIEVLDNSVRLRTIHEIFGVTTKPLVMDGDTGGRVEHFEFFVRDLERAGVSAVIIEDKTGLKRNSLLGNDVPQTAADVDEFAHKISRGKAAQTTDDFMIFARIESLILGHGIREALFRADRYVEAGADGIMIHSRSEWPDEVLEFAAQFRRSHPDVALVSVPTTYNAIRVDELQDAGFTIVIYANHMLRAALKAMHDVSHEILRRGRTAEAEERLIDLKTILHMAPVAP